MTIELSSDQFEGITAADKVRLLEQVCPSLCSEPDSIASTEWHSDVLAERSQRLLDGSTTRLPWDETKARLQSLAP